MNFAKIALFMGLIVGVALLNSPEASAVRGVALVSEILALICFFIFCL